MISDLSKPTSGRSTASGVARDTTARLGSVCDETCPTESPVTIADAPISSATASAARSIWRLSRICQ